jgi:phosphoglycerate dehydrogenase-like enzyme
VQPRLKLAITGDLGSDFKLTESFLELMKGYEILRVPEILNDAKALVEVEVLARWLEREDDGADELLETLTNLRWVHSLTSGVEKIVLDQLLERNVVLTNSAGCYAEGIAE